MNRVLTLAFFVLLFVSCGDDNTKTPSLGHGSSENMKSIILSVAANDDNTRIAVDENSSTDDHWNFVWEENESILAWYADSEESQTSLTEFTMSSFDPELSTFEGKVSENASQIRLLHPFEEGDLINDHYYNIDISTQESPLDHTYMMTSKIANIEGVNVSATPSMKHIGSFWDMCFKLENPKYGVEYKITKVELCSVPTSLKMDLTGDFMSDNTNFYDEATIGNVTAIYESNFNTDGEAEIRLNLLPFNFAKSTELTINVTFMVNDAENRVVIIKKNDSERDILFERSVHNFTYIDLDGSGGEIKVTGCTITDWVNSTSKDLIAY